MKVKSWYYFFIPLVGFLFFVLETYFQKTRFGQLSEDAMKKLAIEHQEIESKLQEILHEGKIAYALEKKQLPVELYEDFSKISHLIEGWALYYPNGRIFAKNQNFFPQFLDPKKIPHLPSANKRFFLHENKWFFYLNIAEDTGFLLLSLSLPKLHPKANLGVFHPIQMEFYLPQNLLSNTNFFIKLKERFTISPLSFAKIDAGKEVFLVNSIYWKDYSLYLLTIISLPPFYYRLGFYFFLLSILLCLALWLTFTLLQKKPLEKTKEKSEEILNLHHNTVQGLQKALSEITTHWDIPKPIAQAEYAYVKESAEFEESQMENQGTYKYKFKEPLVIEVVATNKEFIFPDIDEEVPIETPKEIEKLRKKAFTTEVLELFDEVKKAPQELHLLQALESLSKREIDIDSWLVFLNEIYFDEITPSEINRVLAYLCQILKADALALLTYNPYIGCYQTSAHSGLDLETNKKLYILSKDSLIPLNVAKNIARKISYLQKKDPFFKKRFSKNFLDKLNAYLAIPLHSFQIPAYLIAFYFIENPILPQTELEPFFLKRLKEVAPALKYFLSDSFKANPADQVNEFLKEMRLLTSYGQKEATILHIFLTRAINEYDLTKIREKLNEILTDRERFLLCTPYHIIFLLSREKELSVITDLFPDAQNQVFYFPERGINYLSYF